MTRGIIDLLHFFPEILLLLWFFERIKPVGGPVRHRWIFALGCAALILPLHIWSGMFSFVSLGGIFGGFVKMVVRICYRIVVCILYLRFSTRIKWRHAAYFSGLFSSAYHMHLILFDSPLLHHVFENKIAYTTSPTLNTIIGLVIIYSVAYLMFRLLRNHIPFDDIDQLGSGRITMVTAVILCTMYVKSATSNMEKHSPESLSISFLLILLVFLLLTMIVCVESYLKMRRIKEEERIQDLSNAYALKSLRRRQASEEDTRALAHDMKNHLLAIRRFTREGNGEKVSEYIDAMFDLLKSQEELVATGGDLLDGILSEKLFEASEEGASVSVIFDSKLLSFVSDADLCTIFGNALDNAVEACRKVKNRAERFISIHGGCVGGHAVVTIANSSAGEISMRGGLPITSKTSATYHGIGLKSICRTLEKYDGSLTIDTERKNEFCLTIMLPLPENSGVKMAETVANTARAG